MAQSANSDPFLALNSADPYTSASGGVDPFTGQAEAPPSSATLDFLTRMAKSGVESLGTTLVGVGRKAEQIASNIPFSEDWMYQQQKAKAIAEGKLTQAEADAASSQNPLATLAAEYHPDPARDKGIPAIAANVLGNLAPVVAAGPAAPFALAGQIAEAERQRALAEGESQDVADARYDLGLSIGLPVAFTPLGVGGRAAAGPIEAVVTKAALGGALGLGGDAALQGVQQRDFDWKEAGFNAALGAGGAAFMGLLEKPRGQMAQGPAPAIDHEANIAAIAASTGKSIEQVRADYYAERGVTPPTAIATVAPTPVEQIASGIVQEHTVPAKSARDAAEVLGEVPIKSAEESARALESEMAIQSAQNGNMERAIAGRQGATPEVVPDAAQVQKAAWDKVVAPAGPEPTVKLSAQAQRMADEYGAIDPRVMLAFGRSAIGGIAGYYTGDTPEEKVRDALIGAGVAFGLPHIADALIKTQAGKNVRDALVNEARDFWKRVDPLVLLPTQALDAAGNIKPLRALVRETFGAGSAQEAAISGQATAIAKDLARSISGTGVQQATIKRLVQSYLVGDAGVKQTIAPQLSAPVYAQALRARYFIDGLTDDLITRGVVAGNMAQTFMQNRGQYLRRSYEIFSNPSYNTSRTDPVFARKAQVAIDAVHQEMISKNAASPNPSPVPPARSEAEAVVSALIDKSARAREAAQDFLYGRGKLAGKDVSILMQKQDLMPEIRSLLGEITDPIFSVRETGTRMARLLEGDRTQKNIVKIGTDLGLFKTQRDLQFSRELATTDRHSNYNGLFAEPHIADAFSKTAAGGKIDGLGSFVGEVLSREGVVSKTLGPVTYAIKYGKTLLAPITYAPHALHGMWANVLNGNMRFDASKHALLLGAEEIGLLRRSFPDLPSRPALQAEIAYLTKQRVYGQSIVAADLADVLDKNLYRKLRDPTLKTLSFPALPDKLSDQFNKHIAFKSEAAKLSWALPGTAPETIAEMAAKRVRDTLPTYEGIPEVIKGASRAAMLSQFVSFPVELLRNTAYAYHYGLQDIAQGMQTKNNRLVTLGAQRLATMTAGLAAVSAFGVSKMAQTSAGVTEEQDRALRELSPHWIKSAELLYDAPLTKDPKTGNATMSYTNMSYLMAYSEVMQPLNMAVKEMQAGGTGQDAINKALETIKERLVGSALVVPALLGAAFGIDFEKKRPIPATAIDPTVGDRAKFLWSKIAPGIVQWGEQTAKAIGDQEASYGKKYDLTNQVLRLGAMRRETTDIPVSVQYRAYDLAGQLDRANQIYRNNIHKNLEPEQLDKLYGFAEKARRDTLIALRKTYDAGVMLGMTEDDVLKSMQKARIDPRDILAVADGNYRAQDRGDKPLASEIYAKMQGLTMQQRQAQVSLIYKNDPGMAMTIIELMREDVRGMTGKDHVIRQLGVNNGERADYLREQLANQPTPQARQQFIQDMARRGLLSPLIMNQMASPAEQPTYRRGDALNPPPVPPPAPPKPTSQFDENAIYRDPETGIRKRYVGGQFVDAA